MATTPSGTLVICSWCRAGIREWHYSSITILVDDYVEDLAEVIERLEASNLLNDVYAFDLFNDKIEIVSYGGVSECPNDNATAFAKRDRNNLYAFRREMEWMVRLVNKYPQYGEKTT